MSTYWQGRLYDSQKSLVERAHAFANQHNNFYVRASDGRIAHGTEAQPTNTPWIFIQDSPKRHCEIWNQVYFQHFGLLPSFCRFCCWKIVLKPANVADLFKLEKLLDTFNLPSKCGMDLRDYSFWPWAGFIYNDSMRAGREVLQRIQESLKAWFGTYHTVDAFLKRGCTEMEWRLPSDQWDDVSEKAVELENRLDEIFVKDETSASQPEWLKQTIRNRWVKHAIAIGDKTWKQIVNEPADYVPYTVKYDTDGIFHGTMSPNGNLKAKENY